MLYPKPPSKITASTPVTTLVADTFRVDATYDNWRPRGCPDWLLILTVGGAGWVGTDETGLDSRPGVVTLYTPHTPQRYCTDPDFGHWHLLWSHFHPLPHWDVWMQWPESAPGLRSLALNDPVVLRQVRAALTDAIHFSRLQLPASVDLAINALERALLWIHSVKNDTILDKRVRQAANLLTKNMQDPLSLEALAGICGLSVSRLAHLFRAQMGLPPQRYLEELRLQRGAQFLRSTALRIQEIADKTGYASAFYFTTRFRKKFGQSPSAYRRGFK